MSAFLDLLNVYAIWIYLVGVIGILFGIKMLADSRRLSRATMFTLEQEQAGDQAFRAIVVMIVFALLIGGVSVVNAFVGPSRPTPVPVIAKQTTVSFTPALIVPTFTTVPTLTPEPATSTPTVPPTRAPQPTALAQPTVEPPTPADAPSPQPTASTQYPQPTLYSPRDKEPISNKTIRFSWAQDQGGVPAQLPPGEFFRLTFNYTDRDTRVPSTLINCTRANAVDTTSGMLSNAHGHALNDLFTWSVVVMQVSNDSVGDCNSGAGSPISPASDTRTFYWH